MKRLLNYASENGYDGIAITPGAEQVDRYNLANHIDSLDFTKNSNGTVDISGIKDRSSVIDKTMQTPEQIESLVGKEIARRIFDTTTSFGSLTGLDLKVGGEGMKGFYDKMIPDYLNTFGKKYNVQTEMGGYKLKGDPSLRGDASERLGLAGQSFADMTPQEIAAFNAKLDESNAKQLHYFKITPEMREEVKQGMPLYQQIGVPLGIGAAGAEIEMPQPQQQPQQQPEEPAFAAGGAVFNTNPDMTDGGRIIQGAPFKRGGKVHVAKNSDTMFMEMNDKKPNLTKRSSGLINVKRK
jgi:DNA-binding ferritin-like protein (Dps family)